MTMAMGAESVTGSLTRPGGALLVACPDCGARQHIPDLPERANAYCWQCGKALERGAGRSAGAALACTAMGLLLLIPGNVLPVMRSSLYGPSIEARVVDGAITYWTDGWPVLAVFVGCFVVVVPILRSIMLVAVLGGLRLGYRGLWQGRLFRYVENLRIWSMPEVYVLAAGVTYTRLAAQIQADVEPGGWCFVAASVLLLVGDASLNRHRIWQAIRPDEAAPDAVHGIACDACHQVLADRKPGDRCPRCARRLQWRKPNAVSRTMALTVAAMVLAPFALVLPMTETVQLGSEVHRNILRGVSILFEKGFWYFGLVILTASVLIPLVKLIGLLWLTFRIRYPSAKGLRLRTEVHRVIHEINRWSFTDPFIVALTAPVMSYPGIADVRGGPGALPFALVVVLTMLASHYFDSRLMWDAAEEHS